MGDIVASDGETVAWRREDPAAIPSPLIRWVPYLELSLEHPDLEPTAYDDRFFPDAVPYELDGRERVFYWRGALSGETDASAHWRLACATTDRLHGFGNLPAGVPPLIHEDGEATTVVVDGTVAGESTMARVRSYAPPTVRVERASAEEIELTVDGSEYGLAPGDRRRIELGEQRVKPLEDGAETGGTDATRTSVTPELAVRFPGPRELHHPAPDAGYCLFPSFGLDLDDVSRPLSVPTAADELDDESLATRVGVDLAARPYSERVLWQAFAFTAFDPHADRPPALAQLRTGHIVVSPDGERSRQ